MAPLQPPAKKQGNDIKRILPGAAISLILLVLLFWFVDVELLWYELQLADYRFILPATVCFVLSLFVRAIAWRILLLNRAGLKKVFFTMSQGYLFNNILPFRLGELARAIIISRNTKIRFWQAIPTIMVERMLDLMIVGSLVLATLPLVVGSEGALEKAALASGVMAGGFLVLFLVAKNQEFFIRLFEAIQQRVSLLRFIKKDWTQTFFEGLQVMVDARRFISVVGFLVASWVFNVMTYYFVMLAFIPEGKLLWTSFAVGMTGLGVAVPSAPGGLGVVEAALVFSMSLFGVAREKALGFALVSHAIYYLITCVLGIYGLVQEGETITGLYSRLRSARTSENDSALDRVDDGENLIEEK